ncbi:MAG: hypothetical protein RLZZ628_2610 [Bacteroidota bacterium]|jgi:hypothetical protein
MSYIETLRKSKEKHTVAFEEFMLSTRRFSNSLFCFFEGKDNAYYVPRIKRFTNNYCPIKCGGRESVLEVHQLITNRTEYKHYKKAFFIDSDFNKPLKPHQPPIFETPCYSIENLYVSVEVFKEILINEFHFSLISDAVLFKNCVQYFMDRQNEFHTAVRLFNAWYACLIAIRNETGTLTGVKLDDKLPKDFVEISLQSVRSNYDFDKIKTVFPMATPVSQIDLDAKLLAFANCDAHKIFRGKYELQFLIKFIQLILNDSIRDKIVVTEKIKFAFGDAGNLNNEQAINIFEGYAETPNILIEYLQQVTK